MSSSSRSPSFRRVVGDTRKGMGLPPSLCHTCRYVREVEGRKGQIYYRCTNERVGVKYPPQPVLSCAEHESATPTGLRNGPPGRVR
jgi:hypothetical protein